MQIQKIFLCIFQTIGFLDTKMEKYLKKISINKMNQYYLIEILKKYPKINSGRKNYKTQYKRVLKNILMSKAYNVLSKSKKLDHFGNYKFEEKIKILSIKFNE